MQSNEVGRVMAEIIYRFASQDLSPAGEAVIPVSESLRFPVQAALRAIHNSSPPARRKLAVELLELFLQTAVSCMTDVSNVTDEFA
jgi:hypothetical protein